ncbi:FliH/SctL family protein [Novosphingobium colocasiae]|uniref:FliH/SctL family protein n=1 Tax=Novosphingobium colocasiae TaxID=1256513 RepID=UPI0035B404B4
MSDRFVARWPFRDLDPDHGPEVPRPGFSLLEHLGASGGFVPDRRFSGLNLPVRIAAEPVLEVLAEPCEVPDPIAEAYAQGHEAGYADARAQADLRAAEDAAAREGLALSFTRLDGLLEEDLRRRLRDTVAALCEAAIAPLALDEDALVRRIGAAVAMLSRAEDERLIRLHPEDMALVAERFATDWNVQPDPTLERGTIRVESQTGGVEDGPASWRLAIAEALHRC